jgi:hypothetical protein
MRKSFLLLFFVIAMVFCGRAQITVPNTNVRFSFPNGGWKYLQTLTVDKNTVAYLYSYCGKFVIDEKGDTILPHLRIYVKRNFEGSAFDMAYLRYLNQPFQSLTESVEGLPGSGGIAYVGAYNNLDDHKDYMFQMMYFKVKNTVFEFRLETSKDTYRQFEKEFTDIMQSITAN